MEKKAFTEKNRTKVLYILRRKLPMPKNDPQLLFAPEDESPQFKPFDLLIVLMALSIFATFAINKTIVSQQNGKLNAIGKEASMKLSGAFAVYQKHHTLSPHTRITDIMAYLHGVQRDTASRIDNIPSRTYKDCNDVLCYRLKNGAIIWVRDSGNGSGYSFNGNSTTNAVEFFVDPDGKYSNSTTTPGKSVAYYIYYDGKVTSRAFINNPTAVNGVAYAPNSSLEPDWTQ